IAVEILETTSIPTNTLSTKTVAHTTPTLIGPTPVRSRRPGAHSSFLLRWTRGHRPRPRLPRPAPVQSSDRVLADPPSRARALDSRGDPSWGGHRRPRVRPRSMVARQGG